MPIVLPRKLNVLTQHEGPDDFKQRIKEMLKTVLDGVQMLGQDVLVATYIESEITKGGIWKPDQSKMENLFQGRVGLVLKTGATAFKYTSGGYAWEGVAPKVDDWVLLRFADAWEMHLAGVSCRVVNSDAVRGIVTDPEQVF